MMETELTVIEIPPEVKTKGQLIDLAMKAFQRVRQTPREASIRAPGRLSSPGSAPPEEEEENDKIA